MSSRNEKDREWARANGWNWTGREFVPAHQIKVIKNPREDKPGWVIWLDAIGAVQMESPWASPRGAIRCAESIRRCFRLPNSEMRCNQDPSPMEILIAHANGEAETPEIEMEEGLAINLADDPVGEPAE